jgi:hypothetical protein
VFTLSLVAVSFQFAGCVGGVSTSANASPSPEAGQLSVTPNSVSVTASVGSSATQTVTASNTGSGALTIHQVTVTGSGFSTSGLALPATLGPGVAKTFAVAFTPDSPGTMTGSLALTSSVSEKPTVVQLTATGVAPTTTPPPTTPPPANPPPSNPPPPVVDSVTVSPTTASVAVNATHSFSATVQGTVTNTAVTWTASSGTISAAGVYTAPAKTGTATITATSVADPTKSSSAKVTITAAPVAVSSISVSPASASVLTSGTLQLSVSVQGSTTNKSVTWKTSSGTISNAGLFTASATGGAVTITATSVADTTKSDTATITVAAPVVNSVSVSPAAPSILIGASQQFNAAVQGTVANKSVTWSATSGTISANGLFTAPATATTATVKATSVADPTKSASAAITVSAPTVTSVTVSPKTASILTGASEQFTASVQGTVTNKSIAWSTTSGVITSAGVFTASATPGTATITVTSLADPTKTASATVTVAAATVNSISISPTTASISTGGTQQFTASVQGTVTNKAVTWSASAGTISAAGLLTAPAAAGKVTITATSVADKTKSASATVTVSAPTVTSISVSPSAVSILTLATQQFTANVQGTVADKSVTWSASTGAISPAGLFAAGASILTTTVTATSNADKTKSASATVTISLPVVTSISISPATTSIQTGGKLTFSASVKGTVSDTSVTWNSAKGTISAAGAYVAPSSPTTDTVTARSNADNSKVATATITVAAPANPPPPGSLPAFPGAEGGGAASAGGRGGVVMEVTNLNDSGSGSLRDCIQASGPRTCVFRIGGIIHPQSTIRANSGSLTVAGQTAPGGGIVLQGDRMPEGAMMFFAGSDTTIRYLTCSIGNGGGHSPGPSSGAGCMELASGNDQHNVIFDHITFRWWDDKPYLMMSNAGFSPITNTVMQWSLFYEPNASHQVGPMTDDTGGFAKGDTNDDFHHNLLVNIGHRLPLYNTGSGRWVNNIVYNWQFYALLTQGGVKMDIIGNRYIAANLNNGNTNHEFDFNTNQSDDDPHNSNPGPPSIYLKGNIGPHQSNAGGDQTAMTSQGDENGDNGKAVPSGWFRGSPLGGETFPIDADDEGDLDSVMLSTVGNSRGVDCNGNWVNRRDSNDSRIVSQYQNRGNGNFFTNASQPSVSGGSACTESLHDGIPDQWKSANGLSTSDPSLYKQIAPNGYTYLENYMNATKP